MTRQQKIIGIIALIILIIICLPIFFVLAAWGLIIWNTSDARKQNLGPQNMDNSVVIKPYFMPEPLDISACENFKNATKTHMNCDTNYNYWAAAVVECGDIHNLPTLQQLKNIAEHVYHNGNYDGNIAVKYGLPESLDNFPTHAFTVWSKEVDFIETGACGAYTFSQTSSGGFLTAKIHPFGAICVKNM